MHSYLLHFADLVHAVFVLAESAKFGSNAVERRAEKNVGVLEPFVLVVGPNVENDLKDGEQGENPPEIDDRNEE